LRGGGRAAFGSRAVFRNAASQPGIHAGPHPDNEAMKAKSVRLSRQQPKRRDEKSLGEREQQQGERDR
jgi:hypothetical protein